MTDQHPLTDEICENLSTCIRITSTSPELYLSPHRIRGDMRVAADWQLEQVIQAWEQCLESPRTDIQDLLDFGQKLKAMRPQEEN
jgi:hypothetical protein